MADAGVLGPITRCDREIGGSKRAIFDCNYLYTSLAAMGYHQDLIREAMRVVA
jgi:hypothetical protein